MNTHHQRNTLNPEPVIHKIAFYTYEAEVLSVYDGDGSYSMRLRVAVDVGLNQVLTSDRIVSVRLFGVDTPELRGKQREAGIIVRDYVRDHILGKTVILHTHKDKSGKYGRLLADIMVRKPAGLLPLSDNLISLGYAKPYTGGTKEPWTTEELNSIKRLS